MQSFWPHADTAGDGFLLYTRAPNKHLAVWVSLQPSPSDNLLPGSAASISARCLWENKHLLTLPGEESYCDPAGGFKQVPGTLDDFLIWICYDIDTLFVYSTTAACLTALIWGSWAIRWLIRNNQFKAADLSFLPLWGYWVTWRCSMCQHCYWLRSWIFHDSNWSFTCPGKVNLNAEFCT